MRICSATLNFSERVARKIHRMPIDPVELNITMNEESGSALMTWFFAIRFRDVLRGRGYELEDHAVTFKTTASD